MDYEKKYKDAFAWIRSLHPTMKGEDKKDAERYFPELKEIKDEKIIKGSKEGFKYHQLFNPTFGGVPCTEIVNWLEKQCEQKPADKFESKFKVGDWVVYKNDTCQIVKREEGCNKLVTVFGIEKELVNERNLSTARLWTIQDAKVGDVLAVEPIEGYSYSFVAINKKQDEEDFDSYCFVGFDGTFNKGECGHSTKDIHPATKEQRDFLFQKMHEAGYEWDAERKKLCPLSKSEEASDQEQKSAWSEEDKEYLAACMDVIDNFYTLSGELKTLTKINVLRREYAEKLKSWLNSLKDRIK